MLFSPDMRELVERFEEHEVTYALVGGFAVNYYGYSRTTQDVDFLVFPSALNAQRVMAALDDFGFGGAGIPQAAFEQPGSAIHLGVEPNRIDLLTHLKGIDNETIFSAATRATMEGLSLPVISLEHLIIAKRSSTRARDLADLEELLAIRRRTP